MQCFKIHSKDIQKRIDPYFYSPQHDIELGCYHILTFSDICNVITDGDHGNPQYSEDSNGIPYLRVVDVKNNLINYESIQYITDEYAKSLYKSCFAHESNLLISIVGTLGESVLYKGSTPLAISRGFAILEFNEKVIPEYVLAYTKTFIFNKQIQKNKVGSVQDGIYLQSLKEIKIPIPSLDEQQKIAQLALKAYENKLAKEQIAKSKLSNINNIILEILGVEFPNSSEKRCYSISSIELKNNRIDTHYHQPKFSELDKYLKDSACNYKKIKDISNKISSGATPLSGGDSYTDNTGVPFIRSGDINKYDFIDYTKTLYIKEEVHNKMLRSSQLKYNDVLIAIVGATIGQVAVYKDKRSANINQALALVRVDKLKILPEYLKIYMLSKFGQEELNRNKRPVARANLNLDEIGNINILLPDLEHQQTIVNEYYKILEEVDALKKEARIEFEEAKAEVEKMILGEE